MRRSATFQRRCYHQFRPHPPAAAPDVPRILFRDSRIVVVDKPANLLSTPGRQTSDCVVNRLKASLRDAAALLDAPHRLDLQTSGVLALCLDKEALSYIGQQFAAGSVDKVCLSGLSGLSAKISP